MDRIDEVHSFNPKVAKIVGMAKATLLKEIYGWCHMNLVNNRNIIEGAAFTYNSARAFHEKFDYMSAPSISRWLLQLENENILFSIKTKNKRKSDRTKWYTINFEWYDGVVKGEISTIPQNDKWSKPFLKMINVISQNDKSIYQSEATLPSTNTSTTNSSSKKNAREEILEVEVENENPFQEELSADIFLLESLQRKNNLSLDQIFQLAADFNEQKNALGEQHVRYKDWKRNFYFWIPKQILNRQKHETRKNTGSPKQGSIISAEDCAAVAYEIINQKDSYGNWGFS